jgi:hypothetical protein
MLYVTQPGQANSVTSLLNTGNVFAADAAHGNLPFNYHPFLPAVDQYNNIFFATNGNSLGTSAGGLWEVTASGVTQAVSLGGLTMNSPLGVAVDNSGNLLVADCGNNRILSITRPGQSGSTTSVLATSGITLNCPSSVTVDAAGDIYIADNGSARIIDVSISGAARVVSLKNPDHSNFYDTANPAAAAPFQVVVDGAGNLYFVNQTTTNGGTPYGGTLQKLAQGTPLPLTFVNPANAAITPATYFSTTSSDSPQTLIASNIGNALLNFAAPSPAIAPASFVLDASTTCPASGAAAYNLTSGAECNLSVNFTPQTVGAITGTLVLTDNNLNLSAQTQVLNLNGTGVALPTQTTLGSTLNPSVYGQAVTLTATVAADPATGSSAVPTGSVQFFDAISGAPVALGTATLSGGVATLPATAALIVGTHPISATYTPDTTNFAASSAVTLPQQVTPALLTVTAANQSRVFGAADPAFTYAISGFVNGDTQASVVSGTATLTASDTSTSAAGSTFPITFATQALAAANYTFTYVPGTLTISGGATQTITFTLASPVTYGVAPISLNGTASSGLAVSYTVTGPATVSGSTLTITGAGTVTVTAHQPGDANYAAAADVAQTIVVNPALLTVTANNASRVFGAADPVFAATISGYVNGDTSSVVSGAPSFTSTDTPTSPVSPPTYSIVPAQGTLGAANYTFSFANGTLTIVGGATASIALTSSPSTSTFGQSVTFTATVSAATGTPSGSVSFYDQGVLIGSGVLVNGVATLTTSTLAVGTHPITAIYGGDATFAPVTSAVLNQVVGAAAVGMALVSSLNPSASGQAVTFTATLSSASANALAPHQHAALGADGAATLVASALPTGAVNFFDNGVAIGSGTLNAGVATLTTSALAVGAHPITATYAGDKSNGPASAALNQVVNNAVVPPPVAVAAPALNAWALLLLTLTLGALGFVRMRRE